MRNRFATYSAARAYYQSKPAIVSPRRPLSKRAIAFMFGTALAGVAALALAPQAALVVAPGAKYLCAVGAWTFYNEAKKYICEGDIDLNASSVRLSLFTSASNAATATLSTIGSISNEVTEANGYSSSGKAVTYTFTVGASAGQYRMSMSNLIWTATGGNIPNIKHAALWVTGTSATARKLICHSQLSTSQFTLTTPNTLTIGGTVFNIA